MNNLTTIFELEEDPRTGQLMVFCAPTVPADECTIYIVSIFQSSPNRKSYLDQHSPEYRAS